MIEKLKELSELYDSLNIELGNEENFTNIKKMTDLNKRIAALRTPKELYLKYNDIIKGIEEAKLLVKDPEMSEIAKEELTTLTKAKELLLEEIEIALIPKEEYDDRNVLVEIRGAAGGDEANLFAGDLFRMYTRYADRSGWKFEILEEEEGSSGGFTLISFLIKGNDVYSKLKFESGSHRVQRVPSTETQGRIHTSTATVMVMPESTQEDFELNTNDIKTDVYRSSGAGGQSVNTTDSAVRMTHIPTGIVVTCQNERSQIKNREKAMSILKSRIIEFNIRKKEEEEGEIRKSKIGSGDRSEKIRTYNYPQNRLTDHRINFTLKQLDRVMEGDLEDVINALLMEHQKELLRNNG